MHSSEKPSKSWTNSSRVCRNTHRRHFENGSRRHQRDRVFWCFHSVAIFDSLLRSTAFNFSTRKPQSFDKCERLWNNMKKSHLGPWPFFGRSGAFWQEPGSQEKTVRSLKKTALCQQVFGCGKMSLVLWKPRRRKHEEKHQCWGFFSLLFPQLRQYAALTSKSKTARAFWSTDSKDLKGKLFFRSVDLHTQTLVFFMHLNYSQLDYFAHGWQNVQYGIPSFEVI